MLPATAAKSPIPPARRTCSPGRARCSRSPARNDRLARLGSASANAAARRNCSSATRPPVTWTLPMRPTSATRTAWQTRRSPLRLTASVRSSRFAAHARGGSRSPGRSALSGNAPLVDSVIKRPTSALQSRGRAATAPSAAIPLQSSRCRSAQTGTSWRHTTSGPSAVTRLTISSRKPRRSGGTALPWRRSTCERAAARRVAYGRNAGRPGRSSGVHADVRPRARRLARAGGGGRGARDVAFPFGEAPAADGYARRSFSIRSPRGSSGARACASR